MDAISFFFLIYSSFTSKAHISIGCYFWKTTVLRGSIDDWGISRGDWWLI